MHALTTTKTSDLAFTRTPDEIINAIFSCNITQMRLLLIAIGQSVRENQKMIFIPLKDFAKILKINLIGGTKQHFIDIIESCASLKIKFDNDEVTGFVNWFDSAFYNKKTKNVEFTFSAAVYPYLSQLEKYTVIEADLYSKLTSVYAIRWYLLLKSFRTTKQSKTKRADNTWETDISIDEIRKTFQLSDDQYERNIDLIKKVIEAPVKNLNDVNKEFKTDLTVMKEGRFITGVSFTCTDIKITPSIPVSRNDSIAYKNQKLEINKERDDLNAKAFEYKKRADWQKTYDKIYAESKYEFISEETKELLVTADTVQYFDNLLSEKKSVKSK